MCQSGEGLCGMYEASGLITSDIKSAMRLAWSISPKAHWFITMNMYHNEDTGFLITMFLEPCDVAKGICSVSVCVDEASEDTGCWFVEDCQLHTKGTADIKHKCFDNWHPRCTHKWWTKWLGNMSVLAEMLATKRLHVHQLLSANKSWAVPQPHQGHSHCLVFRVSCSTTEG